MIQSSAKSTSREQKVMLDSDLATLYGVATKVFNQAVGRNLDRFPEDFRFQLTEDEFEFLRSQFVTSNKGRGGRRYLPYVFTEQGVAMLSGVLNSARAVQVNIGIMRAFVNMRKLLSTNEEASKKHYQKIAMFCEAGFLDEAKLSGILEKHDLTAKWNKEKWRFDDEE